MSTLLKQVKVTDPASDFHGQQVDILIENNTITDIAPQLDVEAQQKIGDQPLEIMTGWVDVMADFSEPGYEHKETISSGLDAAQNGGFQHVFIVPNTYPAIHNKSMVEFVINKGKSHTGNVYPLGAVSKDLEGKELAEMQDMYHAGAVAFTDGWQPIQNAQVMLKALEYVKSFDGIIIQIPVNQALAQGGLMNESFNSLQLGMPGIPTIGESLQVHRDLELLRYTQSRLHISGVSTGASIELIRKAKAEGLQVTCSVTPYHLLYTDDALIGYDSNYKVAPPLREEKDRSALIAAVLDGTIDCIATHHRSQEWDAKTKEFEYASYGMNTLEYTYPLLKQAIPELDSITLANLMGNNARKIFKLQAPAIAKGTQDFTVIAPENIWTYSTTTKKSLGINSPVLNQELKGKVLNF